MKKLYLFLILTLPASSFSQPVIHNCGNYVVGTVQKYISCITSGVNPGLAGADQIWDFHSLTMPASGMDTLKDYFLPNPVGSSYPTANLIDSEEGVTGDTYLKSFINVGNLQTNILGTIFYSARWTPSTPTNTTYSAVQPLSHRPITYNDSFTSNYKTNIPSLGAGGSGKITIKADGYGILVLPTTTDSNVLRVTRKMVENDTDSTGTSTITNIDYFWYDNNHLGPILTISTFSVDGINFITKTVKYLANEKSQLAIKKWRHQNN